MKPRAAAQVDYSLARRAVLRAYHSGHVSRFEICDAHPDLLRAARYAGEQTSTECPVCDHGPIVLVSYAFSDEFPKRENGKVWPHGDISALMEMREARLYTVEVCPDCSWNHLRSQLALGRGRRGARARASRVGRPTRASE